MPSVWEKFRDDTAEAMTMHPDLNFDNLLADRFGDKLKRNYQYFKQNLALQHGTLGQAKLKAKHLLDLFKVGQPVEVAGSPEELILKLSEILQEMDDTADINIVVKKHLVQFQRPDPKNEVRMEADNEQQSIERLLADAPPPSSVDPGVGGTIDSYNIAFGASDAEAWRDALDDANSNPSNRTEAAGALEGTSNMSIAGGANKYSRKPKPNKAICIFNKYDNIEANNEGWGSLPGVMADKGLMLAMLRKDYDVEAFVNQNNIETCIIDALNKWKGETVQRLHLHFSGHGIINQTVQAKDSSQKDVMVSNTPIWQCIVGNNGDEGLCSVLQVQHLLTNAKIVDADAITITLDCCRSLDRERKRTKEIRLASQPEIPRNYWTKMTTIYATCQTQAGYDVDSLSNELWNVYQEKNNQIPVREMAKLMNNSWLKRGVNQICNMDITEVGDNWENKFWPL